MPRRKSQVLHGSQDQRDRSRRKKHHKPRPGPLDATTTGPEVAHWETRLCFFQDWLESSFRKDGELTLKSPQSLSLNKFLQTTPSIDIAPDEKLRQLAIFLEPDCEHMSQPAGWRILARIYREALRYDASWPYHYHSRSLSALACASGTNDPEVNAQLLRESLLACDEGITIAPDTSCLHSSRGRTLYELGEKQNAISAFDTAIKLDPRNMWGQLYRAHSYHDLRDWENAVGAYEAVDLSFFDGIKSWRAVLLRDQLAICRMHTGDHDKALEELNAALHRYEQNPGLLFVAQYLMEAADGILSDKIGPRVAALLKREGWAP